MDDLKEELLIKMQEYHADIFAVLGATYPKNTAYIFAFESYCRVAALNATKKIIPIPNDQEMFFDEALNDLLSSHVMMMLGNSRVALTAMRAIIENFLYYFYYIDHPVEFIKWKLGKYRVKFSDLFEYLKGHPCIEKMQTSESVTSLESEYATLSKAVHGSSEKFMMTAQANFPHLFQDSEPVMSQWNSRGKNVFISIMTLIFSFYRDNFVTASHKHERQIISIALGATASRKLSQKLKLSL